MRCPFCQNAETRVVDSRLARQATAIRRRRECLECSRRFTSFEEVDLSLPVVVKKDGARQPFDRAKLLRGITTALHKRPVPMGQVNEAVSTLEATLMARGEAEVKSSLIGNWVMDFLRRTDEVAYVRFASIYREFHSLEAFRDALSGLEPIH
jgi:transcriptional repressor NrdR